MNNVKIQVFGSGCASCKKLFELTKKAVAEIKLDVEVEYITDIQKIIELGVMSSPVLAIDGKPVLVGEVPNIEKIKEIIISKTTGLKSENGQVCCSDKNACDSGCKPSNDKKTDSSCKGCC